MERAGDILKKYLGGILSKEKKEEGKRYSRFFSEWEKIIGEKLYGHTVIVDIVHHSLLLEVDHPGWLQLLRLKENSILKKIRKYYPELNIYSIKIRVTGNSLYKPKTESVSGVNTKMSVEPDTITSPSQIEDNKVLLEKIGDQRLRSVLEKLSMSIEKRGDEELTKG
ncbi:MAG: DUF721 domain-containing protein [Spirochaetales bacterium]|nr:DUF721 domain-containing protein [Spirochaetales bacterium]